MSAEILVSLAYLLAIVLFIFGIKRLGKVRTARSGNTLASLAMLIAVIAALTGETGHVPQVNWAWIAGGLVAGALVGAIAARRVAMTEMPEMVALFNGSGGVASMLVALAAFFNWWDLFRGEHADLMLLKASLGAGEVGLSTVAAPETSLTLVLSVVIGAITLTGSLVAYGKLSGKINGNAVVFPGQHALNALLLLSTVGATVYLSFFAQGPTNLMVVMAGIAVVSLLLGVLLVIPIGGADMPVVISLLNSYSGLAASMTGFVLGNNLLIVGGSMVGAAGIILTQLMCKAMNRSLLNVLMGGFGATATSAEDNRDYENITTVTPEELGMMLDGVSSVIFVPGYGLAVAQAQHVTRELADMLQERDVTVKYAIHPVAGRMPGHMNVLLAEANVPYEQLIEMDEINPSFKTTDLVIILGANDVVNPAALDDPSSPLAGMPILNVHEANNVIMVKRSLSPGYAGVKNPLFERDNCRMLFGDAKDALTDAIAELKDA